MSWPTGRLRAPRLPEWREVRVRLPQATLDALKVHARARSKKLGVHIGVPLIAAHALTKLFASASLDEIRDAIAYANSNGKPPPEEPTP